MCGYVMLYITVPVLFPIIRVCALENLALNKPTWQKHPWLDSERDFGSENAVDGMYTDRGATGGQCTINDDAKYTAEWRVDLGNVLSISYINIYYRTDNKNPNPYVNRMAGFSLHISNTTSKDQGHCCYKDNSRGNPSVDQKISCSILGRYVIYYNERSPYNNPSYLSRYAYNELCEVEVYGYRGSYGDCCQNPCPHHCLNGECDAYTGHCRSFIPEHQECPPGYYGNDCRYRCSVNCDVTRICDKSTGQCDGGCKPGWTGHMCDQLCESGYYGQNCSNQCSINCDIIRSCDRVTGECYRGCNPGWTGIMCDQECMMPYYGKNCSSKCSAFCNVTGRCDKVTGRCDGGCKPGWTGNICDQKIKCDNGYFGPECRSKCGHCLESEHCHHINGSCMNGCSHGYRGNLCNKTCSSGFFGLDCINRCDTYCTGNKSCDPIMGICNEGCKKGWSGLMCGLDRFSNWQLYGDNKPIVIGVVLSVVIVLIGSVINFICWRRKTVINAHTRHNNYDPNADNEEKSANKFQQYTELGEVSKSSNYDELHNYSVVSVE